MATPDEDLGPPHVRGWRRGAAVLLAVVVLLPIALTLLVWTLAALAHLVGW